MKIAMKFLLPMLLALALVSFSQVVLVRADGPAADLANLAKHIDSAITKLQAGDIASARADYKAFDDGWLGIEDGIRARSRTSYRAIEDAMGDAKYQLQLEPINIAQAVVALKSLRSQCDAFIAGKFSVDQQPSTSAQTITLPSVVARLDRAMAELDASNAAEAAEEVASFRREWAEVEGLVKAKSERVYASTENNMAKAYSLLTQQPPDLTEARSTLVQMKTDLSPFASGEVRYGVFDAAIILLREGLEALLIIGALLAFLKKVGNADKGRWIWAGSGAGVAVSLGIAIAINLAFSQVSTGANRELLEGVTGLVAAAMLIYVSYWLHSKSSLGAWQQYISDKSTKALARNSLLSLAFVAFLAVFREGAETVLFYLGIAPSIATVDLLAGLGIGAAGLAVLGVLILFLGVRIPVGPFFIGTSILVFYLAFKFIGAGVHALQVSGVLSATPASYLPNVGFLGIYPTWETTAPQLALVALAVLVILVTRSHASAQASMQKVS